MGKVVFDISMSLDGCIAGPNDGVELPLGIGGQRLHDWVFSGKTDSDAKVLDEIQLHLVPVLLSEGRRLFEHIGTKQMELERTRVIESPGVTHLRFRVVKS